MSNRRLDLDQECKEIPDRMLGPILRDIYDLNKNLINQKCPVNILNLEGIAKEYLQNIERIGRDYKLNNALKIFLIVLSCIIIILLGIIIYKI